ncbi:MAG: S-methyl-5'-thioinosine phosphorylase [Caldisericia bacterium]
MIGIIGGSGVYNLSWLEDAREQEIETDFGSALVKVGYLDDETEVAFITRHGKDHKLPPSIINYRANIMALKQIGVTEILATYAVGGINPGMEPGDFAIVDQFIDFTWGRKSTFFDESGDVRHTDVSEPYDPTLRDLLRQALVDENVLFHPSATYICTNGPRYETPAEIKAFSVMGATIVGMTGAQEAALAAEAEIPFAALAVITNLAAGVSKKKLSHDEVVEIFNKRIETTSNILKRTVQIISEQ